MSKSVLPARDRDGCSNEPSLDEFMFICLIRWRCRSGCQPALRGERNEGKGEKKAEAEVEGTSVQKDVGENK